MTSQWCQIKCHHSNKYQSFIRVYFGLNYWGYECGVKTDNLKYKGLKSQRKKRKKWQFQQLCLHSCCIRVVNSYIVSVWRSQVWLYGPNDEPHRSLINEGKPVRRVNLNLSKTRRNSNGPNLQRILVSFISKILKQWHLLNSSYTQDAELMRYPSCPSRTSSNVGVSLKLDRINSSFLLLR